MSKYTVVVARTYRAHTTIEASSKREARAIVQQVIERPETENDLVIRDTLVFDDNTDPDVVVNVVLQK